MAPSRLLTTAPIAVLALVLASLGGCKLLDQRSFDPDAGKPPKPVLPPAPPAPKPRPPFLEIRSGTPEEQYGPVVDNAVKVALARKENALFVVQLLAPTDPDPAVQARDLTVLTRTELQPVARRIIAAGAQPIQVEMHANADPSVTHPVIRVDVR